MGQKWHFEGGQGEEKKNAQHTTRRRGEETKRGRGGTSERLWHK